MKEIARGFSAFKNMSRDIIQLANDYYTLFLAVNNNRKDLATTPSQTAGRAHAQRQACHYVIVNIPKYDTSIGNFLIW